MGRTKIKNLLTSFTPQGDYLSILSPDGFIKIWNTSTGDLLAEWKDPDGVLVETYSCLSCSFVGKKNKKGEMFLLAIGTTSGDVLAINALNNEKRWTSVGCHPGGVTYLSFANKGRTLHIAGADGMVSEIDSKTGDVLGKFKASRKPIASLAFSNDEEILAVGSDKIRIFSRENKTEILKFSTDSVVVQYIAASDGGKAIVSSGLGEKQLFIWETNEEKRTGRLKSTLSMKSPPLFLECRNCHEGESLVVLSVSEAGIAYIWDLKTTSQEKVVPSRIVVKSVKTKADQQKRDKKNRIPLIAARLHDVNESEQVLVVVAYGSPSFPQFTLLEVTNPGEEIVISADETVVPEVVLNPQDNVDPLVKGTPSEKKRAKKKRSSSDADVASPRNYADSGHLETTDVVDVDYDVNEPTMGEKLADLNLIDEPTQGGAQKEDLSSDFKPPSADSVFVLLKQALHADDHALLSECFYLQDEKVIANSLSRFNPSDVFKLLNFFLSTIQSRGGVSVAAIPWLRSLLLQHASGIMSQEPTLRAVNSLYQLIESRLSTFESMLKLSGFLDYLLTGITDEIDEDDMLPPVVYEDKSESDAESEDAMETIDDESELEVSDDAPIDFDSDGMDDMSD